MVLPTNGAVLDEDLSINMAFLCAGFSDGMTCSGALRHTIDIVDTNALDGAPLARIATNVWNRPASATVAFVPQAAWEDMSLCFRFITTDAGGNATTSAFPSTHHFTVVPEPAVGMVACVLLALRIAAGRHNH